MRRRRAHGVPPLSPQKSGEDGAGRSTAYAETLLPRVQVGTYAAATIHDLWSASESDRGWNEAASGRWLDLPDIKELGVAGGSHFNFFLARGSIEGGADVFLGVG